MFSGGPAAVAVDAHAAERIEVRGADGHCLWSHDVAIDVVELLLLGADLDDYDGCVAVVHHDWVLP